MGPNYAEAIAKIQLLRGDVAISVDFSWCMLDDAALECLKCLPQLQELYLSHTEVTDVGLGHLKGLTQLQTLDLGNTNVTDAGLEHLKDLFQLQTLDLSGADVTDAGLKHIEDLLQLQALDLAGAKVTDAGLDRLQRLRQLQELGLSGTEVTDAGLEHIKGLPELEKLCFWATGAGLKHLRGLPRLRELDLGGTKVTDAGLEHLKGLGELQSLGLSGTEVSDAGLEHLKGLRQLRTLDLSFTRVKGPLDPTEWASQGPQFVGLDADPDPAHAAGLGRAQANEQSRHEIEECRQKEGQSLKEKQDLHYLLHVQDRDRQLVSREIHDGFVQQLAAAIMHFAAFSRFKEEEDGEVWKSFEAGLRALNDCMREARQLIRGLRSPIPDECGVVAAIEDIISQDGAQDKPEIDFVHNLDGDRLSPALENTIYRILQEGLANARRYSQSDRVLVKLTRRDRYIRIAVQDWGIGFNPREVGDGHFGLEGIQRRARLFGGSATIKSAVGNGTRIVVQLPLAIDASR